MTNLTPPTLTECREIIIELMGCLEYPVESKSVRETSLNAAAILVDRIESVNGMTQAELDDATDEAHSQDVPF